ncbi:thioesterase II family protein [Cryptosporangium sp. NPDC051539]|uniref:thioesterase II family protein n=1 Tax=Cryptosporangium sp. NPDC051539 TaxID=3363962 RepID=UPI00379B4ED5
MSLPTTPGVLTPWVQFAGSTPSHRLRLLCFHHAGGGASFYRQWVPKLAAHGIDVWPIQLPGREQRFTETKATDLTVLARELTRFLAPRLDGQPYAVYGHSAGVAVGAAFALRMREIGRPGPVHAFLAACRPPSHPDPDSPVHQLSTPALLAKLRAYGGTPPEVFDTPELMEMILDVTRADLRLVETAPAPAGPWFQCPVTALGGEADRTVPAELLPYWRVVSGGRFDCAVLPGGHFPAAEHLLEQITGVFATGSAR